VVRQIKWLAGLLLMAASLSAAAASPDIVLKGLDGAARNVNEFIGKGQWTVVAIWHSDCPICKRDIHEMAFFHDAHRKAKDAIVLGVSVDGYANKAKAQRFVDEHSLDFTNLITGPEQIARFGAGRFVGTPTFYIYSPQGELAAKQVGPISQEDLEQFIAKSSAAAKKNG
jgi:peroxiredoxin